MPWVEPKPAGSKQARAGHRCHATGCQAAVPPEMLMCKRHWFSLPKHLRDAVRRTYRPGQCDDWRISSEYADAAREAVRLVAEKEGREPDTSVHDVLDPRSPLASVALAVKDAVEGMAGPPHVRVPQARLAVNIADLTRVDPLVCELLLAGKLDPARRVVRTDPRRLDEAAVELTCDLLTAACACDVLREHDRRAGDHPCRVYVRAAEAWRKLPHGAVLTMVRSGEPVLDPRWFPADAPAVEAAPLEGEAF